MNRTCLVAELRAMYSASMVLNAVSSCCLLDQKMGQLVNFMRKPVLDLTLEASSGSVLSQAPAKSAFAKHSTICGLSSKSKMSPSGSGAFQVADNPLGSRKVGLLWGIAELGTLVGCKGDVGPCCGGQIVELTNQGLVVERCSSWGDFRTVLVLMKNARGWCWAVVELFGVQVGCADYFVNEVYLSHVNPLIFLNNLNSQVVFEWAHVFKDELIGLGFLHQLDEVLDGLFIWTESNHIIHINDQDELVLDKHTRIHLRGFESPVQLALP